MSEESEKPKISIGIEGFDPLGLKSAGEIAKETVQFGIEGAKEFLKLTCKPLLEEFGLLMKDKVTHWKLSNIINMLEKAQGKLSYDPQNEQLVIDPRVAYQIVEHASIVSNDTLQEMWAGLFASSCQRYEEDENIVFIDVLKRLTSAQAKLINYLCEHSKKNISVAGLNAAHESGVVIPVVEKINYNQLLSIMDTNSKLKADTELLALANMGLFTEYATNSLSPFAILSQIKQGTSGGIAPSLMAIRLYVKGQGSKQTPFEYFTPQIAEFHYQTIKNFINVTTETTLPFLYENAKLGESYKNVLNFGSEGFSFKDPSWHRLSIEELNARLRPYLLYRYIQGIDKVHQVKNFGTFSYQTGASRFNPSLL